ncbi:MAG: O-methyltransferase [Lachnospiraceae bacterium]|nr:O-methyltransferase [Lachnospiraceae bacterium]
MNNEDRIESYIESLIKPMPDYLEEMARFAEEREIPIIRPTMRELMSTLIRLHRPMTILEIGTAVGFSALYMKEYAPEGCRIVTYENYPPRIEEAKLNFAKYDKEGCITLMEEDATEAVKRLDGTYDMVFMDGPKGQYINMYDDVKRLLNKGGLLISDNILKEGDILESRYAVTRRDRTIHSRMREYVYRLTHDEDYQTSVLSVGDGAAISVKI